MKKWSLGLLIGTVLFLFQSCHTFFFQNVEEKLTAVEWMLTPFPKAGEHFISWKFLKDGNMEMYVDKRLATWGNDSTTIPWVLKRGGDSYFLYFPDYPGPNVRYTDASGVNREIRVKDLLFPPEYFRWQIISIKDDELFISHEDLQDRKGGYQNEFIEYNLGCEYIEAQLEKGTTQFPIDMRRCP